MLSNLPLLKVAASSVALIILAFSPLRLAPLYAQVAGATLSGTVTDQIWRGRSPGVDLYQEHRHGHYAYQHDQRGGILLGSEFVARGLPGKSLGSGIFGRSAKRDDSNVGEQKVLATFNVPRRALGPRPRTERI